MMGTQSGSGSTNGIGTLGQSLMSSGATGTCGLTTQLSSGIGKMHGTSHLMISKTGSCGPCGQLVVGAILAVLY